MNLIACALFAPTVSRSPFLRTAEKALPTHSFQPHPHAFPSPQALHGKHHVYRKQQTGEPPRSRCSTANAKQRHTIQPCTLAHDRTETESYFNAPGTSLSPSPAPAAALPCRRSGRPPPGSPTSSWPPLRAAASGLWSWPSSACQAWWPQPWDTHRATLTIPPMNRYGGLPGGRCSSLAASLGARCAWQGFATKCWSGG